MSKLPEIAKRIDARQATNEDARYLLGRVNAADYLIERLKRFAPQTKGMERAADLDDLEAWCEYHASRRDELEEQ